MGNMLPRPAQFGREYGSQFSDASVVSSYHLRPPYPEETFEILVMLLPADCRSVLDLGCGTGEIARRIAPRVERVDAVDPSAGMIAKGPVAEMWLCWWGTWIELVVRSMGRCSC